MRIFIGFVILSGIGWLLDMGTFTALVKLFGLPNHVANFVSSYVGVTFVWFASLKAVFRRGGEGRQTLLLAYWIYQFVSITAYSQILHAVANMLPSVAPGIVLDVDVAAKIVVTPFNLLTNFIFMKFLTRYMRKSGVGQ